MRTLSVPFILANALALSLSACASQPETRPSVSERQLSPREVSPGEELNVSFNLEVSDPAAVERVYLRGLPKNSVLAGTRTELPLPEAQNTLYAERIELTAPASDGQYNIELVFETTGKTYFAPLGSLAVRDTPSRILYSQFLPGSHTVDSCLAGTKLVEFEYTVTDDNGASDFAVPTLFALDGTSKDFVFFPHWEPMAWSGGGPGLILERPTSDRVTEELVSSDIRILCEVPQASLHEYVVKGQSVSRLTGKSTTIGSEPVRYYVE